MAKLTESVRRSLPNAQFEVVRIFLFILLKRYTNELFIRFCHMLQDQMTNYIVIFCFILLFDLYISLYITGIYIYIYMYI